MPRIGRSVIAGVAMHIVQRGNNRAPCFFGDADRLTYLRLLLEYSRDTRCAVHAYCLMTNHIHLLLTPPEPGACGQLMKGVSQQYVQHINRIHKRTGTLWEGRFRSSLVTDSDYVLACYRYIELNPVRAGLTTRPEHYEWSSYRCNADGKPDSLIEAHPVYCGLEDSEEARRLSYRGLFDAPIGSETLDEIRSAVRNCRQLGSANRSRGRPRSILQSEK